MANYRFLILAMSCCLHCFSFQSLSADEVDFDRDIATLLSQRCLSCHRGDDAEADLDLSTKSTSHTGGESGPAVVPGDLKKSLAWQRIVAEEMPPEDPLSEKERGLMKAWIESGANWGMDPIDPYSRSTDSRAGYDWWSLQPLAETHIPSVRDSSWPRNAIDFFVLAKLDKSSLKPSAEASEHQLLRRVHMDITGLPPTDKDLRELVTDGPTYADRVDRLLASPHYGQHWARHWLDVARFGESHGFEYNQPRNTSWHYRNWVIEAFNNDMPYDEFVRLQIAGDAMLPNEPNAWVATGFLVAGPHNTTKPSSQKMRKTMRHDELEDIVGTIGQTFLGLTVNCARCHDHKFDPITQKEYYQLVASVIGIDHGERELPSAAVRAAQPELNAVREKLNAAREEVKKLEEAKAEEEPIAVGKKRVEELQNREKQLNEIRGPKVYMAISRKPPKVARLKRGDVTTPAEPVRPEGLRAVNAALANFGLTEESSDAERRKKLAAWVTGNQNPLLARVIVNRLWLYHFGQGLVRTPSDFGFNGDRPSHPELLDYLAKQLIANNWSLKPIHRLIMNSATYRQESRSRDDGMSVDAGNRLLWRFHPQRMTAEQIRDSILSMSGQLNDSHGGAGYRDMKEYKYRGSHYYDPIEPTGSDAARRTVYRFSPRGAKRTILDTFDCPDPSAKAPQRAVTTTPLQALSLMNHPFVLKMSGAIAERIKSTDQPINQLYRLAYARDPDADEIAKAKQFADSHGLAALCRVVINSNEFLYVR